MAGPFMDMRADPIRSDPAILRPGETCWRLAAADRLSFIVDAADYFAAAKEAILRARRAVYMIGWDFDLDIRLKPGDGGDAPDRLRQFLAHVVKARPDLEIFILQWDGAMLFNITRQLGQFLLLKATSKRRIHFRLDSRHPAGACHHQKIVVIDDAIAFCGGIDMTDGRWDTPLHRPEDRRRKSPHGRMNGPWHDMTVAVDGAAARALGALARSRWEQATGSSLPAPDPAPDVWPESLPVSLRRVEVAIARTVPAHGGGDGCNEVERLWLEGIRTARRTLYIENQFLASGAAADALEARLAESDGPEILMVLPDAAETWLESQVMDSARARIVGRLRAADRNGRFAIYRPVDAAGGPIYVHAKLLIVDDRLVRIGSSNLSNRSMSLDSECDLAVEARGDPSVPAAIAGLRTSLIAEHLGLARPALERLIATAGGSLIKAIEAARGGRGPTLRPLEVAPLNEAEEALVDSQIFNPEAMTEGRRRAETRIARWASHGLALGAAVAAGAAVHFATRPRRSEGGPQP